LYIQEHADIVGKYPLLAVKFALPYPLKINLFFTGCPIVLPRENESVLLGSAILGAVAAKKFSGIRDAMRTLNAPGKVYPFPPTRVKNACHFVLRPDVKAMQSEQK
jgi:ribulose kinase